MADPQFITSNPAVDEYNRANKLATDQANADLEQQGKQLANQTAAFNLKTSQSEAPTRLRMLNAQTQTAETNAQYAAPEAKARLANIYSDISNRDATRHMEVFTKSMDLLNSGNIDAAKALAAQNRETIPDAVVQNAAVRDGLTQLTQRAQQIYPGRPKDQMVWLHSHIEELSKRAASGQQPDPSLGYQQLPGDPVPPEIGGQKFGETQQIISSIMQANPGMTYEQAVAAAHGKADEQELRRETLALNAAKADGENYLKDPVGTLNAWRQRYGLAPMAGQQAAAPARPQSVPQGSAYSPSRQMWRDPQGNLYDATGKPVQAAPGPQASAAPAGPQVPLSQ